MPSHKVGLQIDRPTKEGECWARGDAKTIFLVDIILTFAPWRGNFLKLSD